MPRMSSAACLAPLTLGFWVPGSSVLGLGPFGVGWRRIPAGADHVGGEQGRLFTAGGIVLAQELRQRGTAPAIRQPARGFVADRAIIREQFRRWLSLIDIGLSERQWHRGWRQYELRHGQQHHGQRRRYERQRRCDARPPA